jgi:hypothetical protein
MKMLVTAQTERFRRFEGSKQRPVSKKKGSSFHLLTPETDSFVEGRPVTQRKDSSDPASDKPITKVATQRSIRWQKQTGNPQKEIPGSNEAGRRSNPSFTGGVSVRVR